MGLECIGLTASNRANLSTIYTLRYKIFGEIPFPEHYTEAQTLLNRFMSLKVGEDGKDEEDEKKKTKRKNTAKTMIKTKKAKKTQHMKNHRQRRRR